MGEDALLVARLVTTCCWLLSCAVEEAVAVVMSEGRDLRAAANVADARRSLETLMLQVEAADEN